MKYKEYFESTSVTGIAATASSHGKVRHLYGRGRITYLIDKNGIIRYVQKGLPNNNGFKGDQ